MIWNKAKYYKNSAYNTEQTIQGLYIAKSKTILELGIYTKRY